MRKMEPAVHSVRDDLVNPTTIATLCFLTDALHFTNISKCILQGSSLHFLNVINKVCKLINKLKNNCNNISKPGSYFYKPDSVLRHSQIIHWGLIYWQVIYPIQCRCIYWENHPAISPQFKQRLKTHSKFLINLQGLQFLIQQAFQRMLLNWSNEESKKLMIGVLFLESLHHC